MPVAMSFTFARAPFTHFLHDVSEFAFAVIISRLLIIKKNLWWKDLRTLKEVHGWLIWRLAHSPKGAYLSRFFSYFSM